MLRIATLLAALAAAAPMALAHEGHHGDHVAPAEGVSFTEGWVRPAPGGNSAAYGVLTNAGTQADRLVAAAGDVAAAVEIHEAGLIDGVMQMRRVDGIDIPAGGAAIRNNLFSRASIASLNP